MIDYIILNIVLNVLLILYKTMNFWYFSMKFPVFNITLRSIILYLTILIF